jgi:hypothetical protein
MPDGLVGNWLDHIGFLENKRVVSSYIEIMVDSFQQNILELLQKV